MKKDMPKEFRGGFSAISTIALIVILAILVGGGFFAYQYLQIKNLEEQGKKETMQETSAPVPSPQPPTTEIDTSAWKTYRNEQYGFEVRYPKNFSIATGFSGKDGMIFTLSIHDTPDYQPYTGPGREGEPTYLKIGVEPKRQSVLCDSKLGERLEDYIKIGDNSYQKCIIPGNYFGQGESMFIDLIYGSYIFNFYADFYDENKLMVDQILSTFKFIPLERP